MRIEGAAVDYFNQWIGSALKPLLDEDADTDVLAKYIITLLSTDDNEEQLREHCVSQLTDFLSDETEKFVNDLFDAIKRSPYKESLKGDTSARYQADEDDAHGGYVRGRGRRGDSDDDGSDDDRRYRRGGGRRAYEDAEDDYEYANKRRRSDYDAADRYSRGGRDRDSAYSDHRGPPPSRYDPPGSRYDSYSGGGDRFSRGGAGGSWGRGSRDGPAAERGPLPPQGRPPAPAYPVGGDSYAPAPYYSGGGGYMAAPPALPPHPPAFPPSFGQYDAPYDPAYPAYPPAGPPPLPPVPRGNPAGGMQSMQERPPPPPMPMPRSSPSHGSQQQAGYHAHARDDGSRGLLTDGLPVAPGEESHTVRCTGIPQNVQEKDLFRHFKAFGRIASLKLLRQMNAQSGENGDGRKVYNECYVQFIDPANAKKCVTAPSAVLNNRYIKVFLSNLNVMDPADAVDVNISFARGFDGTEGNIDGPKERAKREALRKYEELKKLRTQEENILKKQEELLEAQIEQHNKILAKLAEVADSEEKGKMSETLEAKIMSLQFKLREVREKRDSSRAGSEQASVNATASPPPGDTAGDSATSAVAKFSSQRGRGAPRGRLGGRQIFGGRGRGRAPFGRGGGNLSVDCRPKSLLVSNIPDGFSDVADQHFARFGKVVGVEKDNASLKVEFSSRYEAEKAIKDGAGYGGSMLTLEWGTPSEPAAAGNVADSPGGNSYVDNNYNSAVSSGERS